MSAAAGELPLFQGNAAGELPPFRWPASKKRSIPTAAEWAGVFFILVNATLFVRPAEIIPALEDWPIYAVVVIGALLAALPQVLSQLSHVSLIGRPITVCVIGMLVCVVLSHLSKGDMWHARASGQSFLKILLYYLLLLATVNSFVRLRRFLVLLVALGVIVSGLALLQYHGLIDIPALAEFEQGSTDAQSGERTILLRLVSTGIFNDPNDLCLLLVITMAASAYGLGDRRWGPWRILWLAPLGLFGYALTLTQSRGGFLGFLSAALTFIWVRLGWRRGLPIGVIGLLGAFYLFAGRQTELSVDAGTGQDRIQIWSQALTLFRQAPLWGIGQGELTHEAGHAAHNSFLHAFAELGFFGGTVFLGAFVLAFGCLHRLRPSKVKQLNPDLARLRPYLMAIVAGYAGGLMSLSRAYVAPTYLVLGLAAAYIEIARAGGVGIALPRAGTHLALRMGGLSAAFLGCMYLFVRLFVHWG